MKIVKTILRYTVYALIALVLAMAILPIVFKDDIVQAVRQAVNEDTSAKIDFSDISLSLFRSFPDANIRIHDLRVDGRDRFEDTPLLHADYIDLDIHLPTLWNDEDGYQVKHIGMENGLLNIDIMDDKVNNYSIFPESEGSSESTFKVILEDYAVKNSDIVIRYRPSDVLFKLENLDHTGKGTMVNNQFDLDTKSSVERVMLRQSGIQYISNARAVLDAVLDINLDESKYTFKENELTFNRLPLKIDGWLQNAADGSIDMDLRTSSPSQTFADYFSILPSAYRKKAGAVDSRGKASFTAWVKGRYNETSMPQYHVSLDMKDGYVKYADLALPIENINVDASIQNKGGRSEQVKVSVPSFAFAVGGEPFDGRFSYEGTPSDGEVDLAAKGALDLATVSKAFPMAGYRSAAGKANLDFAIAGNTTDISNQALDQLDMRGTGSVAGLRLEGDAGAVMAVESAQMNLNGAEARVDFDGAEMRGSRARGKLTLANPLTLLSSNVVEATADIEADRLDLGAMAQEAEAGTDTTIAEPLDLRGYKLNFTGRAKEVIYEDQELNDVALKGTMANDALLIESFNSLYKGEKLSGQGAVSGLTPYLAGEGKLKGAGDVQLGKFNVNDFMTAESSQEETGEIVPVPADMDITLNMSAEQIIYDQIDLRNVAGSMRIADAVASITSAKAKGLGGDMAFSGTYATPQNAEPYFDFAYDLKNLKFLDTYKSVTTAQSFLPIMQYIEGFFNSTLSMSGKLGPNMMPDLASINASGFIETLNSQLADLPVLDKISNKLSVDQLKKIALDNTKNWIEISDGKLTLKPRSFSVGDIEMMVSGQHGLNTDMDYDLAVKVPRELLKQSKIGGLAESGLSFLESEAGKLGVNIDQGEYIDLFVQVGGDIKNPSLSIKPTGTSDGKAIDEKVKEAITDKVNKEVETAKDSVKTIVKAAKKQVEDSIKTVVNTVRDSIENVVKTEVNKQTKKAEEKIKVLADSTAKEILGDSLGGTVIDILTGQGEKGKKKVQDKLKDIFKRGGGG